MIHRPESSLTPDTSDPDRLAELEAFEILEVGDKPEVVGAW